MRACEVGTVLLAFVALASGACRISSEGLASEPSALLDSSSVASDTGAAVEVGADATTSDSAPLFPLDDSGSIPECTGKPNGTLCGPTTPLSVCIAGECLPSRCGDGVVAPGEDCDDKNTLDGDSCPSDCKAKCKSNGDCNDSNPCSIDACDSGKRVCAPPSPMPKGSPCTLSGGGMGVCNGTSCTAPECGNGTREGPEDCDDANTVDTDGCKSDCTWTCTTNADCDDGNACNGVETCDVAKHTCRTPMPKTCNDGNACTEDRCVAPGGTCSNTLVDADGDGVAPSSLGPCGKDCNDGNPRVFPGQMSFFVMPYSTPSGGSSFDYDCDGKDERRYTKLGTCSKSGGGCDHVSGWANAVPGCGDGDNIVTGCEPGSCKPIVSPDKYAQECR